MVQWIDRTDQTSTIPRAPFFMSDAAKTHNARAWDTLARRQAALAKPATDEDFRDPLNTVDPLGWLGSSILGQRVLCLAAGGGRQSALYAAAGAQVTVVDISNEMLALDRQVAAARNLSIRAIQASMDALPMLADGDFDIVIHPVSTCYVADVASVFREVARVTRRDGLYVSQHKSPTSLQSDIRPNAGSYRLREPYYRDGPLPAAEPSRIREPGTLEFLHRWEELVGGICRAGFAVEDLVEPMHAEAEADMGTFGHRSKFVAPYVRIKARRASSSGSLNTRRTIQN
jgi:SAM-dependent methyltransferase